MDQAAQAQSVYQLVVETLTQLGADVAANPLSRRILLVNRNFHGQRFECDGFRAFWLADEGIIRFYGTGGAVLKTVPAPACALIRQAAA
jgi:hypothetical protein